jgi:hypothetical protein
MSIVICPRCQHSGAIPPQHLGKRVKYRHCGGLFVPAPPHEEPSWRRSPSGEQSSRLWGLVIVILLGLMIAGAGEFLIAWLALPRTASPQERPSEKIAVKEQDLRASNTKPVAEKPKLVAETAAPAADKVNPRDRKPEADHIAAKEKPAPKQADLKAREQTPSAQLVAPSSPTTRTDDQTLILSEMDKKWESYHKLIKPQPGEWKFADIPWARTIWEARKKAAEEGKPLFIWYMAGEPLGQC